MDTWTETVNHAQGIAQVGAIIHNGHEYVSGGAYVDDARIVCYPKKGRAQSWDGQDLGTYRVISSRPAIFFGHRSYMADYYYYARVVLHDGRCYSVRGFGDGMAATGKRIKARR